MLTEIYAPNPLLNFSGKSVNSLKTRLILNYQTWNVIGCGLFRNELLMEGQSKAFVMLESYQIFLARYSREKQPHKMLLIGTTELGIVKVPRVPARWWMTQ